MAHMVRRSLPSRLAVLMDPCSKVDVNYMIVGSSSRTEPAETGQRLLTDKLRRVRDQMQCFWCDERAGYASIRATSASLTLDYFALDLDGSASLVHSHTVVAE
eukprot:3562902-Amphidinium_carterae.1